MITSPSATTLMMVPVWDWLELEIVPRYGIADPNYNEDYWLETATKRLFLDIFEYENVT